MEEFMDPIALARLQFGAVTIFHFFFVPLTIGLTVLVAVMQTIYVLTDQDIYKKMTKFWGKLLLINFAIGVVTGIVQEFQFGMNWSEYSRYVGDIFGAPLAIEALLAFYLESTFLGVWIFGWDRLPKKVHLASIWLVAIGSNLSALWILIANSFMQQPVGYMINPVTMRAEMTDFFAVILNPNIWVQFPHTVAAGLATAAFFIMGISAYHLHRKTNPDLFRRSFQIAAIVGVISVGFIATTGHTQTQHIAEVQPMKIAAAEALWRSEDPASFSLLTIGDLEQRKDVFAIRIPAVLSLLSFNQLSGRVEGIHDLQERYEVEYGPGNYIPPVAITYWSFRIMVGVGTLMLGLGIYALFKVMGESFTFSARWSKIYVLAIFLPYLANTFGWVMTEMGRMPWVVYGLLKLEDSISPNVSSASLLFTLIGYVIVYGLLMAAEAYLMVKFARAGGIEAELSSAELA
jgi:cytochrome bd ubiquinol oxidase subunit I